MVRRIGAKERERKMNVGKEREGKRR